MKMWVGVANGRRSAKWQMQVFTTQANAGRAFSLHGMQTIWQVHEHVFGFDASFSCEKSRHYTFLPW